MKNVIHFILIGLVGILNTSCSPITAQQNNASFKIGGLSYAAAHELLSSTDIAAMQEVGANYVALMPYAFIRQTEGVLHFNSARQWEGETIEGISKEIDRLRNAGLQVMLKPHVWISHGEYTGAFKQNNETSWSRFEQSYQEYILAFAKVAQQKEIELFCIGTEWRSFIKERPKFWLQLIKKVRAVYSGKLTYASNWDEYLETPFWNELDYIGINAYFPLSNNKNPSVKDINQKWQPIVSQIRHASQTYNKQIIFTEYGYRSIKGTTVKPWESYTKGEVSLNSQADALEALYQTFWNNEWFAGGFLWKWFHTSLAAGGRTNLGFTPQGKPALQVVKKYYSPNL